MKIRFSLTGLFALCLIYLFLSATYSYASDYYVSPDGNDSNPGTLESPWQHIAYATCGGAYMCPVATPNPNKLQAGDVLYIREGTYNERLILIANSGDSTNWITIRNYPGETPVIDGGYSNNLAGESAHGVFHVGRNYIVFDGLEVMRGWRANFYIGGSSAVSNIIIQNCDLHNLNAYDNSGHIVLSNTDSNILIRNNKMHGIVFDPLASQQSGEGVWIAIQPSEYLIENNEMYDVLQGVWAKYKQSNITKTPIIRNNLIHDLIPGLSSNGIEINNLNTQVVNNVIYNAGYRGIRLGSSSCSGGGSNILVSHNTIINTTRGIVTEQPGGGCPDQGTRNNILKDNLIYNFIDNEMRGLAVWPNYSVDNSNITFDHNLIYSNFTTLINSNPINVNSYYYNISNCPLSVCTNNIQQEPIFVDYANKNFTLASNSPGYRAASDGTDMGADISLVGINPGSIPGDLNGDGKVSIADIQLCIKVILNQLDPIDDAAIIQKAKELAAPYDAATIRDIQEIIKIILSP